MLSTETDSPPPDTRPLNNKSMKKNLSVVVEDEDLLELMRILIDDDAEAALAFLKKHFKGKARDLLEGG
jgi:hypothetical protein